MSFCKHRVMDKCKKDGRPCIFSKDCFEEEEKTPQTNADRIRAMTDEELAVFLATIQADLYKYDRSVGMFAGSDANENYSWLQKSANGEE